MDRRTIFITAAAGAAVLLAGTTAVAANIGILNAANDDSIGQLNSTTRSTLVESAVSTTVGTVPEAPDDTSSATTTEPELAGQRFKIDDAGAAYVQRNAAGVELVGVKAKAGWTWTTEQSAPTELTVTFISSDETHVFVARLSMDGTILGVVDDDSDSGHGSDDDSTSTVPSGSTPTGTTPSNGHGSDDDDSESDDGGSGQSDDGTVDQGPDTTVDDNDDDDGTVDQGPDTTIDDDDAVDDDSDDSGHGGDDDSDDADDDNSGHGGDDDSDD